jgi:hypothetical protein
MVDALKLLGVGLGAPPPVVVLAHIEEAERDDLVLVADVARVIRPLEAGRLAIARVPRAPELVPRAGLEGRAENMTIIVLPPVWADVLEAMLPLDEAIDHVRGPSTSQDRAGAAPAKMSR